MKVIAKRFYYQHKNWEFNDIKRQTREEELRMTPEEKDESIRNHQFQLGRLHAALQERKNTTKHLPAPIRALVFKLSTKIALSVAEHFEMNVDVTLDDHIGHIRFVTDQLISERMWNDQGSKCQLLRLMRWSDGLWIDIITENDQQLVQISLTYNTAKPFRKR